MEVKGGDQLLPGVCTVNSYEEEHADNWFRCDVPTLYIMVDDFCQLEPGAREASIGTARIVEPMRSGSPSII